MNLDSLLGLDDPDEPVIPPTRPPRGGTPPVGPIDLAALSEGSGGYYRAEEDEDTGVEPQRYIYHIHGQGRLVLWRWNWWGELCRRFLLPGGRWQRLQKTLIIDRIPFKQGVHGQVILTTLDGVEIVYSCAGYGWYAAPPHVEVERYTIPLGPEPCNRSVLRERPGVVAVCMLDLPKLNHVPNRLRPSREAARQQASADLRCVYMDMEARGLISGLIPRLQLRGYGSDDRNCHGMQAEEVSIDAGCFEA